jgi:cytochrome c oxidase cbb3-type subunit 3
MSKGARDMSSHDEQVVLDHDYDGIRELDNLLPRWWLYLFYVSIVFSIVYLVFYHILGLGFTSGEEYQRQVNPKFERTVSRSPLNLLHKTDYHPPEYSQAYDERAQRWHGGQAEPAMAVVPEIKVEFNDPLTDAGAIESGKKIFVDNCLQCHGPDGQGGIGPNLTDKAWIHGNLYADTVRTVAEGVPVKGMITWKTRLSAEQIHQVTSYIYTLRGTTPPNPKKPEGKEY